MPSRYNFTLLSLLASNLSHFSRAYFNGDSVIKEKIERLDKESDWIEWIRQSENSTLTLALETIKVELLPYALHMLVGLSEVIPAIEVERMNYS